MTHQIAVLCFATLCSVGCASRYDVATASHDWDGRTANDLIESLGPPDKITVVRDEKLVEWFRLGPCRVAALTSVDGVIKSLETQGSVEGCGAYRDKLRK
ncbi:MAG: hypothetical protein ABIS17_00375 [Casimicrobiaceae bacterium]